MSVLEPMNTPQALEPDTIELINNFNLGVRADDTTIYLDIVQTDRLIRVPLNRLVFIGQVLPRLNQIANRETDDPIEM